MKRKSPKNSPSKTILALHLVYDVAIIQYIWNRLLYSDTASISMGNLTPISINTCTVLYREQLTHSECSAKTKMHGYYRCQGDLGKWGQVASQWAREMKWLYFNGLIRMISLEVNIWIEFIAGESHETAQYVPFKWRWKCLEIQTFPAQWLSDDKTHFSASTSSAALHTYSTR